MKLKPVIDQRRENDRIEKKGSEDTMSRQYRSLPRKQLGFFPTPLVTLDHLSDRLGGPRILMKRDDQTGLASGGNKTRKLEFLIKA